MPQVSKVPVARSVYLKAFEVYVNIISRLKKKSDIAVFLNEFFTPTEKVMFVKRFVIPILYEKGYTYRGISDILKVSTGTVNRIVLFYEGSKEFKRLVERLLKEEEMKKFLLDFGDIVSSVAAKGGTKASSWFALNQEIKKKKAKLGAF